MILDYRWPDEIDPSEVEGIADACNRATLRAVRDGDYDAAEELTAAAKLLRILADACEGKGTITTSEGAD